MSEDPDAPAEVGEDEAVDDPPETDGTVESDRSESGDGSSDEGSVSGESTDDDAPVDTAANDAATDGTATDEGADGPTSGGAPARDMTVNVGIITALVATPLVWVLLEGVLTLFGHHPGTWQLRLITVGVMNLLFWTALGIDESRDDDWVGLAAVGWLLVLLPLWLVVEVAVVVLELTSLSGLEQTGLRLGISGMSAVFFGLLLDRLRD